MMYHNQPSELPRSPFSRFDKLLRRLKRSPDHDRATRATSLEIGTLTDSRRRGSDATMGSMSSSMIGSDIASAVLVPSQFTATSVSYNGRRVNGMLTVTHNTLLWHAHNTPSVTWPLQYIRRYGYDNGLFTVECGRQCRTGAGVFTFVCRDAQAIFHAVQSSIETINAHKMSSTRRMTPRLSSGSMESGSVGGVRGRTPDIVLPREQFTLPRSTPRPEYSTPRQDYCMPNKTQLMIQLRGKPRRSERSSEGDQTSALQHRRLGSTGNDLTHLAANTSLSSAGSIGLSNNSVFESSPTTSSPTSKNAPQHEYVNVGNIGRDTRSASVCAGLNPRGIGAQNSDYINCPVLLSASTSNVDCDYVTLEMGQPMDSSDSSPPGSAPPVFSLGSRRHSTTLSVGSSATNGTSSANGGCYAVIDTTRTKALQDTHRHANRHRQETMNLKQIASPS